MRYLNRTGLMYTQCMNIKREIKTKDDREVFRERETAKQRDDSVAPFKHHRDKDSCFSKLAFYLTEHLQTSTCSNIQE